MASIESLLNPLPDFGPPKPSSLGTPKARSSSTPRAKRHKAAKDAPIFLRGKIRGELRYLPCEERDEILANHHHDFRIHPIGEIAEYPRHIPYNSEKKSFQEKTGRESFEVFQYTFTIPGEDKEWTVMWDYNIGLVRTTHLFKCNDYSKTTPAKMLNANPGLREICHSITGGALAAQGYWMPFDAAKAVAATFCWKIRYALTPLFGLDFPGMCAHPHDRARFGKMIIDPAIVKKATETANYYRSLEVPSIPASIPYSLPRTPTSCPSPGSDALTIAAAGNIMIHPQPRSHGRHSARDRVFGTPQDYEDFYCFSPTSQIRNSFTPVNTPRSLEATPGMPSPSQAKISRVPTRLSEKAGGGEGCGSPETDSTRYSELSSASSSDSNYSTDIDSKEDTDFCGDESDLDIDMSERGNEISRSMMASRSGSRESRSASRSSRLQRPNRTCVLFAKEVKAAHALLSLHMQIANATVEKEGLNEPQPRPRSQRFDELKPAALSSFSRKRRRVSV